MLRRPGVFLLLLALFILPLSGCGGGGGNSGGEPGPVTRAPVPLRFTVSWAARSRIPPLPPSNINAPASALSVTVIVQAARPDGSDFSVTLNRDTANPAAYVQEFVSSEALLPGEWQVIIRFFAEPNGGGALVGVAQVTGAIQTDGTGIGNISAQQQAVQSVVVSPGQSVFVGETKELAFSARDTAGGIVAVSPGSVQFRLAEASDRAQVNAAGVITGAAPGTVRVIAVVDGRESAPQTVAVNSHAAVTITAPAAPPTVPVGAGVGFAASVANAPNGAVVWSVQEGAAGGTIAPNGVYTAPQTAGTYHVIATSVYDPAKSAILAVHVTVSIAINPPSATLTLNETKAFTATVTGSPNTAVTWSVLEGAAGGTITPGGVYTAPSTPGEYHVVAISAHDPAQFVAATVVVQAGNLNVTVPFPESGDLNIVID